MFIVLLSLESLEENKTGYKVYVFIEITSA